MFGPEFIRINQLIKTAWSAVFFLAVSSSKFSKRDISSASENVFPGLFGDIFGCSTSSKKIFFSTQEFVWSSDIAINSMYTMPPTLWGAGQPLHMVTSQAKTWKGV